MKREREKTIRLAMILVAIVAVIAITLPYMTSSQTQAVTETTAQKAETLAEETGKDDDATVLGVIMFIGIVAFEAGTFRWILKKEKEGYTFS